MLHVLYKLYYCVKLQSHIYANQYLKLFHTQFAKKMHENDVTKFKL